MKVETNYLLITYHTMERIKRSSLIITIATVSLLLLFNTACEKYDKDIKGDVELYLLKEYNTNQSGAEILSSGIVLEDNPLVEYSDLMEYDSKEYTFTLSASALESIGDLFGSAFAVTVDKEVIYTGYFWSALSSAIVEWVIIDLTMGVRGDKVLVQLGYPWTMDDWDIPDKRNDRSILSVFARDGKLVD